ncbi:MAG: HEAT repeat domain-containing protein [Candidatus Sulfotelmatobacter sp.]
MAAAIAAINSDDVLTQNEGVESVIQIGAAAVPELLRVLEGGGMQRMQAMYALSEIGDTRAAAAFRAGLSDGDDKVRAYAARGLAAIGDPQAQAAAIATLNDAADKLHADITPSVRTLGAMGLKVVPAVLELLLSEDAMTRLRAERVLAAILAAQHGAVAGRGFPSPKAEQAMRADWSANGDYDYSAVPGARRASVEKWRQWLARKEKR